MHQSLALRFYKDFLTFDDLRDFAQLLTTNNIPYAADMPGTLIDQAIVGTGMLPRFIIKLLPEDFKRANALLAGAGMGYYYAFGKTVDPDGNKHFVYAERTRDWGKIILLGGTLGLLVEILILLKVFGG